MAWGKSQICAPDSFVGTVAMGPAEVFLVLKAYFDESGIHEDSEFCVVAGYFGGMARWKELERSWKKVVESHGVREFHAKRFFGRDPSGNRLDEYEGWSDARAENYIDSLTSIVRDSAKIHPISCCLVKAAWNELSYGQRRFVTGGMYRGGKFKTSGAPSKAYFVPFQYCIVNTAHYCGVGQRIHFVFDLNEQFKGFAKDVYALLKGEHSQMSVKDRLGPVSFERSEQARPIQVADLLTYLTAKYCERKISDESATRDHLLRKLVFNSLHVESHAVLDRRGLAKLLRELPPALINAQKPVQKNQR